MSKAGVNNAPMKQDVSPFKKDNRGPHNTSSNDKRNSDSFSKSNPNNRDRDRSSRPDRGRDDYDRRNTGAAANAEDDKSGDKPGETTTTAEKKFTGRCRLFVGNLTPDITEAEFKKMFETYGEISEVYVNTSRGFGFIRLDYRQNAEAAKAALDGTQRKGRILRVRFATHGAALKVKNLHPFVSNELLEQSFSQFGELERCIVIVDDRGKSTGEGIVEFVRKPGANSALRRINEGVFLMGVDPKPVAVEPLEQKDEEDGMPEKFLTKTEQYKKEREKEPRFAPPGTFEYEFGMRWKQLEELEKQRIEQIKKDTEDARLKLEDEMQNALYEYQAEQIRQDLIRQQEELRRLEELRNSDRLRRQQEMEMRRQQDERDRAQQEERRRADMMMSMRQQEIARGRSGPLDAPGMRSREEMMMAERFADRMPDRMNDRMPDRMGDRMGQGPGFNMWQDEKQRSEVMRNEAMRNEAMRGEPNMRNEPPLRNEGGRGREMRGPGASPLQGPPGPPSGMNNMERAGPSSATAVSSAGGVQNMKSSPKPLMQPGGSFGMNSQSNNSGPNNMGNAGGDNGNMGSTNEEEKFSEENDLQSVPSHQYHKDERSTTEQVSSSSPDLVTLENHINEDSSPKVAHDCESSESTHWNKATKYRTNCDEYATDCLSPDEYKEESSPNNDINSNGSVNGETSSDTLLPIKRLSNKQTVTDSAEGNCHDVEMIDQTHARESTYTKDIERDAEGHRDNSEISTYQNCSAERHGEIKEAEFCERNEVKRETISDGSSILEVCDSVKKRDFDKTSLSESCLSPLNMVPVQSYMSSDSSYSSISTQAQSTHNSHCNNAPSNITALNSATPEIHDTTLSNLNHCCQSSRNEDNHSQNISSQISCSSDDVPVSYHTTSPVKCNSKTEIDPSDFNVITEQNISKEYDYSESEISNEFESDSHYEQHTSSLSCYKQHLYEDSEGLEEMEEDEESGSRKTIPNDYQSYDVKVPVSQYVPVSENTDCSQLQEVCFEDLSLENELIANKDNSSYISSDSASHYISKEKTDSCASRVSDSVNEVTELSSQQSNEVSVAGTLSPSLTNNETDDSNEGALRTGDQNFKTTSQETSSEQPAQPSTQVSGVDPSSYSGTTLIQGVKQPPMMSSSTVHIAQHQGATIMQHRSMTTGFNGGLAQSTVVQKQALPNGLQTAMLQQRTITNGGQTMLVQQRTMTNVLGGGVAQQTVVQQRVVPSPAAQSAALHAQALRRRALATQQASFMQHQALRMAHAQARVIGNPLLQAQTLAKTAVIQPAGSSPLIGPRLVQASMGRGSVMQRLVRQRYMGSPVLPARGVQMISGRPVRVKLAYSRDNLGFGSNT